MIFCPLISRTAELFMHLRECNNAYLTFIRCHWARHCRVLQENWYYIRSRIRVLDTVPVQLNSIGVANQRQGSKLARRLVTSVSHSVISMFATLLYPYKLLPEFGFGESSTSFPNYPPPQTHRPFSVVAPPEPRELCKKKSFHSSSNRLARHRN